MPATVDKEKCTACNSCVDVCPSNAIAMDEKADIKADDCIDCGVCVDSCQTGAITLDG